MRDSLEKNLEPIETRFEYLRIPIKLLYADLYPLSKVIYCLFMLDNNYTAKRIGEILYKKEVSSIVRCINELRKKGFLHYKYNCSELDLFIDDTEYVLVPFNLLYKINNRALVYYSVLKYKKVSDEKEAVYELLRLRLGREAIYKYIDLYKKLKLI